MKKVELKSEVDCDICGVKLRFCSHCKRSSEVFGLSFFQVDAMCLDNNMWESDGRSESKETILCKKCMLKLKKEIKNRVKK